CRSPLAGRQVNDGRLLGFLEAPLIQRERSWYALFEMNAFRPGPGCSLQEEKILSCSGHCGAEAQYSRTALCGF
ncbi:hypothetical protein, partial [Xanthomonas populi]|uniref:hypothetical protein n=1 Tax=Xanthomonas populi TaxID=53414 RepID=UPI001ABF9010